MTPVEKLTDPVLSAIGTQTPVDRGVPVQFHDFEFDDRSTSRIAIARHRADPAVSVVASLGGISNHVFICIVDGLERQFAEALAKLEHIDTSSGQLRSGDYVEFSVAAIAMNSGWVGAQLLEILESGPTTGFPTHLKTTRGTLHCLWVVPLNESDLRIRKEGLEQLLDHLQNTHRNPMNVRLGHGRNA